jgi:hypothetical protein
VSKSKTSDCDDVSAALQDAIRTDDSHNHSDGGNHIRIQIHGLRQKRKTLLLALVQQLPRSRQSPQQQQVQLLKVFS